MLTSTLLILFLILLFPLSHIESCTTIIFGRYASTENAPITTHNNDCTDCDIRISVVPSLDISKNSPYHKRFPVFGCKFTFPRYIGSLRGNAFSLKSTLNENLTTTAREDFHDFHDPIDSEHEISASEPIKFKQSVPLGFVQTPKVECPPNDKNCDTSKTHSFIDGSYGISNSAGLSIGESTCAANLVSFAIPLGDALFDVSELMRFALRFCATARCAINLMGSLAETYGYYLANDPPEVAFGTYEEGGEALTIVDTEESWVFHILADDTGKSAVWCAQRLRDDHMTIVPNKFIIRQIDLSDSKNYLCSSNVYEVAQRANLFNSTDLSTFSFTDAYAPDAHEVGWGNRRTWWVFDRVAPSLKLDPERSEPFPFSVKVEKPLNLKEIMFLTRSHFEGSKFDLTKGLSSGPYNNPNRYDRRPGVLFNDGYFERAISIHRTTYAFVHVCRKMNHPMLNGVTYFAHHAPHSSLFIPLYSSTKKLHHSFETGSLLKLSRNSAWWAFASVENYAEKMYRYINQIDVRKRQDEWESQHFDHIKTIDSKVLSLIEDGHNGKALDFLTDKTVKLSEKRVRQWWLFFDHLLCKFRDGQALLSPSLPLREESLFYPLKWLKSVGYFDNGPLIEFSVPNVLPKPPHPDVLNLTNLIDNQPRSPKINGLSMNVKQPNAMRGIKSSRLYQRSQSKYFDDWSDDDLYAENLKFRQIQSDSNDAVPIHFDDRSFKKRERQYYGWISFLLIAVISTFVGCVGFYAGIKYQQRIHYQPLIDY